MAVTCGEGLLCCRSREEPFRALFLIKSEAMSSEEIEMEFEDGSLEEPTEDPELVPESERVSQGVIMTPGPQDIETLEEYVPNEPVPEGVEVVGFDFIEAFLSLTEDLHQHPETVDVARDIERAVPEVSLRIIEDGLGGEFSPDIKSFYRLISAMSFQWSIREGEQNILGGAFEIIPFMRTFGLWVGELWPEDPPAKDASLEEIDEYDARWRLRGFDMPEVSGTQHDRPLWGMIGFDEDDLERYDMFVYHPVNKGFLRMDVSLIDYLYCVLGSCGAPGWQLLFTDYDFDENPWEMPDPRIWIERVSRFFPSFDVSFFTSKLPGSIQSFEEE